MPRLELVEVDTEATLTPASPLQHHQQSYDQNNTYYQHSSSTHTSGGDQSDVRSSNNPHRTTSLHSPPQTSDDDTEPPSPTTTRRRPTTNDQTTTQEATTIDEEAHETNGSEPTTDEEDEGGILFSCRCESARPVITLLSCLRNVSVSNSSSGGYGASTIGGGVGRVPTSSDVTTSADGRRGRGGGKVQYAAVIVSDTSVVFQVHGVGRQSRATVEMQAGLFSEFYVSEQSVPILADEENDGLQHEPPMNDTNAIPRTSTATISRQQQQQQQQQPEAKSEIIKGGEFGINLTTVLECLGVLGSSSLDRATLCLSYDTQFAIFKIELLEDVYVNATNGVPLEGPNGVGVVISNCAIPGMSVAEETDAHDDDDEGQGLDYAFRLHPVIARARIKSEFLKDAINELADVAGAIAATVTLSRRGLELATFGHSTECLVVLPYIGNHPEIFISLEGMGHDRATHGKTYPIHSILSSMRGLEIANETCISINANGMITIQHQVLDLVGSGQPNYIDFIMGCLEEDEEEDGDGGKEGEEIVDDRIVHRNESNLIERDEEGSSSSIEIPICDEEPESKQSKQIELDVAKQSNTGLASGSETEDDTKEKAPTSLFSAVGEIGLATNKSYQRRREVSKAKRRSTQATNSKDNDRSSKRQSLIMQTNQKDTTNHLTTTQDPSDGGEETMLTDNSDEREFEEELSIMDATTTVSFSDRRLRRGRRSQGGSGSSGAVAPSSPQLMYGDTHLEASEDF